MANWLLKRVGQALLTVAVVFHLTFALVRLMPGNPYDMMMARMMEQYPSNPDRAARIVELHINMNPDAPLHIQYLEYMSSILGGSLGYSLSENEPVTSVLAEAVPWTLFYISTALVVTFTLSLCLGAIMAYYEGTQFDTAMTIFAVFEGSTPYYVVALLLVFVFGYQLEWFPTGARYPGGAEVGLNPEFVLGAFHHAALPILSLIVFSFNSGGLTFPFIGFSTEWYTVLFENQGFIDATFRSLQLALVVTAITIVLSTATALAYRYDFWGQRGLLYLLILGIITPGITYGVGASLFLTELLGLDTSLWLATPVHVVWTVPFAVIILLAGFPRNLAENERAARVMGADRWTRFREIILPQIAPTVLGAAVFAFTLSYNEATRGLLLVGRDNTLPIAIFAEAAGTRATPELFALGSVTTIFSTVLLAVGGGIILYASN